MTQLPGTYRINVGERTLSYEANSLGEALRRLELDGFRGSHVAQIEKCDDPERWNGKPVKWIVLR